MYNIIITTKEYRLEVAGDNQQKRYARFENWHDACEACRVIDSLMTSSTYAGSHVVSEEEP
jgi:hypothetical protein